MTLRLRSLTILLCLPIMAVSVMVLMEASHIQAPANVYPMAVMLVVLLLSTTACVKALWTRGDVAPTKIQLGGGRTWLTVVAIATYVFAMRFDYVVSTAVFIFVLFLYFHEKPLSALATGKCALIAVAVTAFVYVTFVNWLGVDVPSVLS